MRDGYVIVTAEMGLLTCYRDRLSSRRAATEYYTELSRWQVLSKFEKAAGSFLLQWGDGRWYIYI